MGLRRLKKYLNNAKILIICNLDKNIKAITELLQENSYNVLQAQDYNSALEVAFENEPDLILLSVDIQNMDSLALLKKLKTILFLIQKYCFLVRQESLIKTFTNILRKRSYKTSPPIPKGTDGVFLCR